MLVNDSPHLYKSIDEHYESALLGEISWLPESVDDDLLMFLSYFRIFIQNVKLKKLTEDLKTLKVPPSFIIKIKDLIASNVKQNKELTPKNKAQILNIVSKFSPIFSCLDELIACPIKYLDKYNQKDDYKIL
jgi:hypothetical protein